MLACDYGEPEDRLHCCGAGVRPQWHPALESEVARNEAAYGRPTRCLRTLRPGLWNRWDRPQRYWLRGIKKETHSISQ
ncbi:hypothetical protein NDU88_004285 [Pleurodeles waltl]|uniref:Uncharacterized protein n=1 Tax=Pleurodeles waltl TaxID=8319 RepID=A0AAV7T7P0_PLEWA|nr:hypothetical protein NDU88_004285 [Pleurodeles waltl]